MTEQPPTNPPLIPPEAATGTAVPQSSDVLYSESEVRRALESTILEHPAFAYYPAATRQTMLEAVLANIDEHVPARIQPAEYLKRLQSELRHLQQPGALGRQAVESAVRLGGKALLDRARQQAVKVVQETKPTGEAEVKLSEALYTRPALEQGIRETLRSHPHFGHYPEATRQELQDTLLAALDGARPQRLTYGTFLRQMLDRAGQLNAAEPLTLLGSAAKGAGKSLFGTLKKRVHDYTASSKPEAASGGSDLTKPDLKKPE